MNVIFLYGLKLDRKAAEATCNINQVPSMSIQCSVGLKNSEKDENPEDEEGRGCRLAIGQQKNIHFLIVL